MDRRNIDIVLVRMDKIGDLVLTMPVDSHPALGGAREHWFISSGMGFVPENALPRRSFTEFKRSFSFSEFFRMCKWLRANKPQTIILLHNPWWVSLAAWSAGVPERIGRLSQWHSFLFYNLGIRQKRSASDRHESDYNFDLVEWGLGRLGLRATRDLAQTKSGFLRLRAPGDTNALGTHGLKAGEYRVVHPGMAGSALNWPSENFSELIADLARESVVVITGTKMDAKYLEPLKAVCENKNVCWLVGKLNTRELLDILASSRSVVAPSTGVLHLAASLGRPALGIYSPRRVEHPRRWGPKGDRVAYVMPRVNDDTQKFPPEIMSEITPAQVKKALQELETARDADDSHTHPGH